MVNINLTKTDFKEFLICEKCLWLKKKKPELYVEGEVSGFLKKLIKEGYEVEDYFQKRFPEGVLSKGDNRELAERTKELVKEKKTIFQATFETAEGLLVKVDVLDFNQEMGKWDLYEVKAASEMKKDLFHNHPKDIAFQKVVLEKSGLEVSRSFLVFLNKEYVRRGELNLEKLFVCQEMDELIEEIREETEGQIEKAVEALKIDEVDLKGCECLYRSHGQRCDCFELFNPQVPKYSTAHIVGGKKLVNLVNDDVFDVKEIPDDFPLTKIQKTKVDLQKTGLPKIRQEKVEGLLGALHFPLYFLDYETFGKAVPVLDGYKPNQQMVFQYSLHVLGEDGELKHFEFLAKDLKSATKDLLKSMRENIGPVGSVVVWNESFEKGKNKELMELHPEHRDFLENLNERVFDLMVVFKKYYLSPDFYGSASIKKVLPVMCPGFSYSDLEVQDGTMAMDAWGKTIFEDLAESEVNEIRQNLLKYCELDTLAMVKIFEKLKNGKNN
jgi:CRISPR/Cas system-associated exonuclease Cas4 (RecB family)